MRLPGFLSTFLGLLGLEENINRKSIPWDMIIDHNEGRRVIEKGFFEDLKLKEKIMVINENFDNINLAEKEIIPGEPFIYRIFGYIKNVSAGVGFIVFTRIMYPILNTHLLNSSQPVVTADDSRQGQPGRIQQAMSIGPEGANPSNSSGQATASASTAHNNDILSRACRLFGRAPQVTTVV